MAPALRVLIVAEHASARFGGEAILPLHWFRLLRSRGLPARLIVHERTRAELEEALADHRDAIEYVADGWFQRALWRAGEWLPRRLAETTLGVAMRWSTQRRALRRVRALVAAGAVDVVHQPIPVSPKEPSLLAGLGVPVVIGPMNGGMEYPPAFRRLESGWLRAAIAALRRSASLINLLVRGKREATTLLVANDRTERALPRGCRGRVARLVENGVDFALFAANASAPRPSTGRFEALFVGRLVDVKALDVAIAALARLPADVACRLTVVGDGPMRATWEATARAAGVADRVEFLGFRPQSEVPALLRRADALLLPSIRECGGAVVLEAMAMRVPVVATGWGGPADYVDERCGVLVAPTSREALVAGFAQALTRLARQPEWRAQLAAAAFERCREEFDWERKLDAMLAIYREACDRFAAGRA